MSEVYMKRHYSDYAQHALRFYFKVERGDIPSPADPNSPDGQNYEAARKALTDMGGSQVDTLKEICLSDKTVTEVVPIVARGNGLTGRQIWGMMAYAEKRFCVHRGLIDP